MNQRMPYRLASGGLFMSAAPNGSPRTVDFRLYRGDDETGTLIDAGTLPILDLSKREDWRAAHQEELGEAAGKALTAILVEVAGQVIQSKSPSGASEETAKKGQGKAIEFPEPTPWPEPVSLGDMVDDMETLFGRFLVMPEGAATAAALWVVLTYCVEHVSVLPRLALLSATKRCGKTSFLRLLAKLSYRSCPAANISPAALYRTIEMWGPTLLLDEADQFLHGNSEMTGLLNAGHTRDTAFVIRNGPTTAGDDWEPRMFSVYTPLVIAAIGKLPADTLADRSVVIHMERKRAGTAEVEDLPDDPEALDELCTPICRKISRWVADHGAEIRRAKPDRPAGLHDRAKDNWRALFALADLAGGEWPTKARAAALRLLGEADVDDSRENLLADIYSLFVAESDEDRLPSEHIVGALVKMEHRSYAEWGYRQRDITQNALARALKPFKIKPKMMRAGEGRGYHREDFEPVWRRYGIPQPQPTATTVEPQALTESSQPQSDETQLRLENPVSPCGSSRIAVAAVGEGGLGGVIV